MSNQQRLVGLVVAAMGYGIKFAAYNFLTPVVLLTFAALMSAYITLVGPEMPFLQYFSFLLPIDGRGNASINEDDIMKAFGLITMALFVLSLLFGWLVRGLRWVLTRISQPDIEAGSADHAPSSQNPLASAKRRLLTGSIVITLFFLVAFIAMPLARMAEGASSLGMYPLFIIFYVIALGSHAFYTGIDILSDLVLGWAWARVLSSPESIG